MVQHATIEDWQQKIDALNKEAWAVRVSNSARAFSLSHGGELRVDSEEGKGTSFYIVLPVQKTGVV